jgi:hypothetical protein
MEARRSRFWERNAHGPRGIPKPEVDYGGGIFLIFRNGHDLNNYWNDIKLATEMGELGYYSAFSPDEGLICVHHSDAWDNNERRIIKERIGQILGISWDVHYITQQEANHLPDYDEQHLDNTLPERGVHFSEESIKE